VNLLEPACILLEAIIDSNHMVQYVSKLVKSHNWPLMLIPRAVYSM